MASCRSRRRAACTVRAGDGMCRDMVGERRDVESQGKVSQEESVLLCTSCCITHVDASLFKIARVHALVEHS